MRGARIEFQFHQASNTHGTRLMRRIDLRLAIVIVVLAGVTGCQVPEVYKNKPLIDIAHGGDATLGTGGYRLPAMPSDISSPELVLLLAFSGGGKRSSAFSYGALRGLRDIPFGPAEKQHRLLDEVDIIHSVSGGSFTSAYYGLYRDRIFTDFEKDFLRQDLNSYIWGLYLLPWHWTWMFHHSYGTNDHMQELYDELMFHGATYADLKKNGRPAILLGATDISSGRVFTFNQDTFDLICSDLSQLPIARAVAASNGLPILFSPITLENHAESCKGYRPEWLNRVSEGEDDAAVRRRLVAAAAEEYLDSSRTHYLHLSDGGIRDNLALRGLISLILAFEDDPQFQRAERLDLIRRFLVVSVDGEAAQDTSSAREEVVSGWGRIISAVSGSQIDAYNFETMNVMRETIKQLVGRIKKIRCGLAPVIQGHPCDDVEGDFVHISLDGIKDETIRKRLQSIPTGLTIADDDVDALVAAGEDQIKASQVISRIVRDLNESKSTSGRSDAITH
jgi:NTE family protein